MTGQTYKRQWKRWISALFMLCLFAAPALAATPQHKRQQARSQFEIAERMREELNGLPQRDRSRREYQRVMDAYRRVYYTSPASSKADASVVAVAELLAESGRSFNDVKALRAAIAQYEFLRREYPGSKYRFDALFTIGQIYKDDLEELDKARDTFQEVIRRYPHLQLSADAREAIVDMDSQPRGKQKARASRSPKAKPQESATRESKSQDTSAADSRTADSRTTDSRTPDARAIESKPQDTKLQESKPQEVSAEAPRATYPLVTGIRHWSTPDYTRVAIDLEQEVKYEAGRVPNPDRIFFDLHDTKLASTLVGKTFEVSDGFLRRVRIAQFHKGMVRVVLEVDDVSDYSAFLLPNPYRLIVDIHGRKPNTPQTLVARAQQQEEIKASTSSTPPETKPEKPQPEKPQTSEKPTFPSTVAPLPSKLPTAADAKPSKLPAGAALTSAPESSSRPAPEYGPRLADGSFVSPAPSADAAQESTNSEVANMKGSEFKATDKPTSEPTVQVVAPRGEKKTLATARKNERYPEIHQAQPSADGQRSLIRALGLKVGRIVIDAGHGGHDTGTIGPNGLLEKTLVLDVALRLGKLLKGKMGADVIYTRDDDTFIPLETRTAIANQQQADLFISVHANSSQDPSARGVETYYLNFNPSPDALEVAARENAVSEKSVHELGDLVKKIALKEKVDESREFATDVQFSLYQGLAGKEKTLRNRGVKKAPFIVLIGANMPSILAEISFVSNPGDARKLQTPEYRQKIAESLYKGVARYINGLSGVKVATKVGAGEGEL
ncbi:MAG TPA: N-acetylmuramoyl-L-alanine amidase [Candidatus Saccharimonadales bacterium]|nr:N-acetylmuramoyl-L-alanine amidase [Candidatus Saccharimonadales bacterium]